MESLKEQFSSFFPSLSLNETEKSDSQAPKSEPKYASETFKLPIDYLDNKDTYELSPIVSSDLELVLGENNVYSHLFNTKQSFSQQIAPLYVHKYTTNVQFLEDSQYIIENINQITPYDVSCNQIQDQWTDVKHDPKFMESYGYLEWSLLEQYNKNSLVMQSLTLANMLSPLMSFFIPILFLIFPFIILKIQGVPITLAGYLVVLKEIAKHHFIGKALMTFESFSIQNFLYLLGTLALYGLQMYQNTMQCIRFYKNTEKMNKELCVWKQFVSKGHEQANIFLNTYGHLETYKTFCNTLRQHRTTCESMIIMLEPIRPFKASITKTTEIGYMLKCYYELHSDSQYEKTLLYLMGFNGYLHLLNGLYSQLQKKTIQKTTFITGEYIEVQDDSGNVIPECVIKQQYYYSHDTYERICNDVVLDTFGVITGPNASGKTTYLKTTAINVILSQQFGVGFFESCKMRPYNRIHSYLNIPDTSGRDSLFQAESRRCKEILEIIKEDEGRQFCIFDELYSGTNPKEATKSAYAFLEYLRQYKHVDLFLTTHYVSICDKWKMTDKKNQRNIQNYMMVVNVENGKNVPTYKINEGISRIEGALGILQDMDYPEEMIHMVQEDDDEEDENNDSESSGLMEDIDV